MADMQTEHNKITNSQVDWPQNLLYIIREVQIHYKSLRYLKYFESIYNLLN